MLKPQASLVNTFLVKPEKLESKILSSGSALANQEVEMRSEISGKIVSVFFKEGASVVKGEALVKLYDGDLRAQEKKMELQKELEEKNEARQKQLLAVNGISQQDYDLVLNQLNTTKADIELTKIQIEKTEIKAPFNGKVGFRNVSVGSYISPNIVITIIEDIDPVKIDFSIPEQYMNTIKNGDPVRFTVQGSPEKYMANIYAIEPRIDLTTRTIHIRAICPNKDARILPGSFAKIELASQEINNAIMIPTEALIPGLKGQKVFLLKNGKAQAQEVETGIRTDTKIQITKGLQQGDTVITTGIMQLKTGSQVKNISHPPTEAPLPATEGKVLRQTK